MGTRRTPLVAAVVMLGSAAACGGDDDSATAEPVVVEIIDFTYDPGSLTVSPGTEITFRNGDTAAHTATARDGSSFNTESIAGGAEATVTVPEDASGDISYFCSFHPFMEATVVVE
jgi:plastocyanin